MNKCPACGFRFAKKLTEKQRSSPQNRYFHGVLLQILSDELGYTLDEIKGIVKHKFHVKHTSSLKTAEFEEFMSQIRQWASSELSIWIPEPNESDYDEEKID